MDIQRFDERVARFENQKKHVGKILIYGNSYLDFWNAMYLDILFCDIEGIKPIYLNHSIGGITGAELLYYYPRLVKPYLPKMLIWCEGANDFEQGYTIVKAFDNAKAVFDKARVDFPDLPIILMTSIRPPKVYRSDYGWLEEMIAYDRLLKIFAYEHQHCLYLDIEPFFLKLRSYNIYLYDDVHLNELGYNEFTQFVKPQITHFIGKVFKHE